MSEWLSFTDLVENAQQVYDQHQPYVTAVIVDVVLTPTLVGLRLEISSAGIRLFNTAGDSIPLTPQGGEDEPD